MHECPDCGQACDCDDEDLWHEFDSEEVAETTPEVFTKAGGDLRSTERNGLMNKGFLEVGLNGQGEIVINHPDLKPDADGVGHIVFSVAQARHLAYSLLKHAGQAEYNETEKRHAAARKAAEQIPVDRTARVLTDGSPVTEGHREIDPSTGMQKGYVVLSAEERAKGFVRPVRRTYTHKTCQTNTTMGLALAETYARDPGFYSGTFCVQCRAHFPLDQFVWVGTEERVGS